MGKPVKITDLSNLQARAHLKESKQYASMDLPPYFNFDSILLTASSIMNGKDLKAVFRKRKKKISYPKNFGGVNYTILSNKDGAFAWRPIELIHPVLYIDLVNTITEKKSWGQVKSLFLRRDKSHVECISIPLKSSSEESNKAETVSNWWDKIEQESLRKSLDYKFMFQTDVSNCYPSIYTHSIEWAFDAKGRLGIKKKMANKQNTKNLGTAIDEKIRNMNRGQTIGIPQGSTLMDFIAEMVMAGTDIELSQEIDKMKLSTPDFKILRYRDDYRIFTSEYNTGHNIMKCLNTVLYNWNMKMNSTKTSETSDIVSSSIKSEKLDEIHIAPIDSYFQKQALRIHILSKRYPNSGLIAKKLTEFFDKLQKQKKANFDEEVVIAILTTVAQHSPSYMPQFASIVSEIIGRSRNKLDREVIIKKIIKKFNEVPNTDLIDVWLQRITDVKNINNYTFSSVITEVALGKLDNGSLWNSDWLNVGDRKRINIVKVSDLKEIIDDGKFSPIITREEFELYHKGYDW